MSLLVWGPAALKLADRDNDIGWTESQRAERIGLIVQNRRFLVLAKTRMPNLASRALALAVNALPAAWAQAHGYRPLLAETFTDIEAFEGTCYKAAAWQPCGITKGFTREHRCDYFFRNDRPKKLWLRVLHRHAGPNWALNASLAILRVALISVRFRQGVTLPWPQIFERCAHSSVPAMSLLNGKSIK